MWRSIPHQQANPFIQNDRHRGRRSILAWTGSIALVRSALFVRVPTGYTWPMDKQQALDRLTGPGDRPNSEVAHAIMVALEHCATLNEVAERMDITPEELELIYPGAISEAGQIGSFRHSTQPLASGNAPEPLYVHDHNHP